uniref:Rhodopsin domain-containing protein n=1 Tax=Magnaporthiopsis poae (strain ATCC 64411 / 73-15) TaxID=644358 RepID=A0A0C4E8D4_MAGP6
MSVSRVLAPHAPNLTAEPLFPQNDVFDSLDPDEGGGGSSVQKALWLLVGLSAIFLGLRLYCKQTYPSSRLRWEDAVLVMLAADASIVSFLIFSGFSSPGFAVTRSNITAITVAGLSSITVGIVGQSWSKTSFAMTLLRMTQGWMATFIWFAIVSMNILFGVSATLFWVGCDPVEKRWRPLVLGHCDSEMSVRAATFGFYVSIYSGLIDIILALLPWPILLKLGARPNGLELSIKEKIGVALAMSMGVVAGAMAFVKASWQRRPGIMGRGRDGRDHHGVLDSRPAGADQRPGHQGGSPPAGAPRATQGNDGEADSRRQPRPMEGSVLITVATARPGADIAAEAVVKGRRGQGGARRPRQQASNQEWQPGAANQMGGRAGAEYSQKPGQFVRSVEPEKFTQSAESAEAGRCVAAA